MAGGRMAFKRENDGRIEAIEKRLGELAACLEGMDKKLDEGMEEFNRIGEMVDKHEKLLLGNGKPGIVTIVDRLEQLGELLKKIAWLLGATLIGAFLLALFNHLIGK